LTFITKAPVHVSIIHLDYCNTVLNLQSVDVAGDSTSIKSVSQGRSQEFVSEGTKEGVPSPAGGTQMG